MSKRRYIDTDPLINANIQKMERWPRTENDDYPAPKVLILDHRLLSVCQLYFYVNTPPLAVGVPGTKIAESVIRSMKYNRIPFHEKRQLFTIQEADQYLNSLNKQNFSEPSGNTDPRFAKILTLEFLKRYHREIDAAAALTVETLRKSSPSLLTKGRQTWDPITERSIPAPDAYKNMDDFYFLNLGKHPITCYDWISFYFECMNKRVIKLKKYKKVKVVDIVNVNGSLKKTGRYISKPEIVEINSPDSTKLMSKWLYSFCGYLKSKERNKLNRRAIASPNIVIRMFLYYVETFHLELGKKVDLSTIAIGGEEKRKRISSTLSKVYGAYSMQGTEDATKWNECLSSEGFYIMAKLFFCNEFRISMELPKCSEDSIILAEIMKRTAFMLHKKKIFMGQGHMTVNKDARISSRFEWKKEHKKYMNSRTSSWFSDIEDIVVDNYLEAPFGMLMGMLNAASTTWGLIGSMGVGKYKGVVTTVRSSDDSMSGYIGSTEEELLDNARASIFTLKTIGINMSEKKSRFYKRGLGEYTSWYQDDAFVAQYGVETSSMRPSGSNPADDFHNAAKACFVRVRENKINPIGALSFINLSVDAIRRTWKVKRDQEYLREAGVSPDVVVLANGGKNPWDGMNCQLAEIPLREYINIKNHMSDGTSAANLSYLQIIMDPNNPFSLPPMETYSYDPEIGTVVESTPEIPRNVFNCQKRSNATMNSIDVVDRGKKAQCYKFIEEIFNAVKPISAFRPIDDIRPMNEVLITKIKSDVEVLGLKGEKPSASLQKDIDDFIEFLSSGSVRDEYGDGSDSD